MNHTLYLAAAYAVSGLILSALTVWIMLDQRIQKRKMHDIERRNINLHHRSERQAS